MALRFVAIDFETANTDRTSVCAVGLAVVRDGQIVGTTYRLVRPPTRYFHPAFVDVHGLSWEDVHRAPDFRDVWEEIGPLVKREVLVAHVAHFDRDVLAASLKAYRIRHSPNEFVCTAQLARTILGITPVNLAHVCRVLGIRLRHHHAESDARAAAQIAIRAAVEAEVRTVKKLARLCL